MRPVKTFIPFVASLALVAAFATPTLAKKTVILDEELDEVTAAGQPKIAQSHSNGGTSTAANFQVNVFAAHIGGQTELFALTLNNVFGENQVANGVNIQSGDDNSGDQSIDIGMSWGSAKAHDSDKFLPVPGVSGEGCLAIGIIAKCNAGDAVSAQPGQFAILWEFADEIADAENESGPATAFNFVVTIVAGSFEPEAQSGLTALTVNNIFGFNQVANGMNISGGFLTGIDIGEAGTGSGTGQNITVDLHRGAPADWQSAPTFSDF